MITPQLKNLKTAITLLKPDPKNAMNHPKSSIEAIKKSLGSFGQVKPIVALTDGTVIAGNGTLEAAKQLGWKELAVVCFKDEAKARAFALADNRTAQLGEWNLENLVADLQRLDGSDLIIGFTEDEVRTFSGVLEREGKKDGGGGGGSEGAAVAGVDGNKARTNLLPGETPAHVR